ncbi:MAG TPA: DUF1737 domain-containing protein [Actinocrinis sp.]|nr:DUF1737 domain-containing protein [Actinocrinis sp.]
MTKPPNDLPRYRVLTGPDDEEFCRRVSEALDQGYVLHGGPALGVKDEKTIVAQAVVWPEPARASDYVVGFRSGGSSVVGGSGFGGQ